MVIPGLFLVIPVKKKKQFMVNSWSIYGNSCLKKNSQPRLRASHSWA